MSFHNADRAASYGVRETNPLSDAGHDWDNFDHDRDYTLSELQAAGGTVSRLRLLTEGGYPYMDISYCHATLPNGRNVRVNLADAPDIRKGKGSQPFKADLIEWAKRQNVYGKKIGLLDEGNWSILS